MESNSVNTTSYKNIYNYGYISGFVYLSQNEKENTNIVNYGTMGGVSGYNNSNKPVTIDNRGTINLFQKDNNGKKVHFTMLKSLTIQNYAMMISESASAFNSFDGNATDNSHLVLDSVTSVSFADANAKMILDFGGGFEAGKEYALNKLVVDTSGTNKLIVEFSRLVPRSDIYSISQSGDYFIATLNTKASTIGNLYKANVRTMNNFYTMSNSMIYPHKFAKKRVIKKKRVIRRVKKTANLFNDSSLQDSTLESHPISSLQNNSNAILSSLRDSTQRVKSWQSTLDSPSLAEGARGWVNTIESLESLESLESNESFAYKSDSSNYYADNSTTNQNKTNHIRIPNANERNQITNPNNQTRRRITTTNRTLSSQNNNYHFILTPFINHNLFFESGRYNLSGFEYGFLTAFSGKLNNINALGVHFGFSYGSLKDNDTNKRKGDKEFDITSMNLMLGLNYKLDLIYDMYIKARGDFYYFLNQVKTLTIFDAIKPNNFGFGLSVAYGKDFDFKENGILGIEVGLDYKALQSSKVNINNNATKAISEIYNKSLYNLIYVDLGLNYSKYFNTNAGIWGLNAGLGIKGNITANKLAKSQIHINNLNRNVNMVLDNDKILGYANISASYVLNTKNFDMEFSLAYYGNFGDRVISNGGGVEWRVLW